ncbi:transcriptional regulator [Pseudomonas piscis]|uniref:Chaperone n=1 Tax=Pseudomonas piscis TaxID=2614538 RepID=A0A7X1PL72_9PSED|nr:YdaS family helix-turn-helix protein [Pseudomonas piscis]MQA53708.1 chaperone [Pseudomonas piscis]
MTQTAIKKAASAAGSQSALARHLKVTPQAVQKMCATGRVPAERVLDIERLTGVHRSELRPDLYPSIPEEAGCCDAKYARHSFAPVVN